MKGKQNGLNKCDLKDCTNDWSYRVNIIDLCEEHYRLWKSNEELKKE